MVPVLQMEAVECGAAALAGILRFHGLVLPLEQVRLDCDVSRDGTNALNIVKAARRYGLQAKGFRKSVKQLENLQMPVILHWNFCHFLILEGIVGDKAYLSDPAQGRSTVSLEELRRGFSGVLLAFSPGPEFKAGRHKPTIFDALARRLQGARTSVAYLLLASLVLVIPGLAIPAFTTIFVDDVLVAGMRDHLVPLVLAMVLTLIVNSGLTWLKNRQFLLLHTQLMVRDASGFFWHLLKLPIEFYAQRQAGDVAHRVSKSAVISELVSGELPAVLLSMITAVFYLSLMLLFDPVLTAVSIVMVIANLVAVRLISRRRAELSRQSVQQRSKLAGSTVGGLSAMETLKASGRETEFFRNWSGAMALSLNASQKIGAIGQSFNLVPSTLASINTAVILTLGGARVMDGVLTLGMLVAFQGLAGSFAAPVMHLVNLAERLQMAEADLDRVDDVLRYDPAPDLQLDGAAPVDAGESGAGRLRGELEIRDLSYGYQRHGPPLIEGFNLRLWPGRWVALVGGSGSGKSTVSKLVCGLLQPWGGEILFDGEPRSRTPRQKLASSLAFVDQQITLFNDTIRANIAMWDTTLDAAQVQRAASDACIHETIVNRRDGYDEIVSERGRNFSGGQQQRMEIARALAVDPTILVLDEATSALDPLTEKEVMDNLRRRGCACLVVAHRLSTIRDCDEILVMDGGKVVERGNHETLLALDGHYAGLVRGS